MARLHERVDVLVTDVTVSDVTRDRTPARFDPTRSLEADRHNDRVLLVREGESAAGSACYRLTKPFRLDVLFQIAKHALELR